MTLVALEEMNGHASAEAGEVFTRLGVVARPVVPLP
jgi:hypothetical protein